MVEKELKLEFILILNKVDLPRKLKLKLLYYIIYIY